MLLRNKRKTLGFALTGLAAVMLTVPATAFARGDDRRDRSDYRSDDGRRGDRDDRADHREDHRDRRDVRHTRRDGKHVSPAGFRPPTGAFLPACRRASARFGLLLQTLQRPLQESQWAPRSPEPSSPHPALAAAVRGGAPHAGLGLLRLMGTIERGTGRCEMRRPVCRSGSAAGSGGYSAGASSTRRARKSSSLQCWLRPPNRTTTRSSDGRM